MHGKVEVAAHMAARADFFLVVGTSMVVYPAAGLVNYCQPEIPIFIVDPGQPPIHKKNVTYIHKNHIR